MSFCKTSFVAVCLMLSIAILACEGGTRGTGGTKVFVLGTIEDRTNAHLGSAGVLVTGEMLSAQGEIIDAATDQSQTDGSFDLSFEDSGSRLSLRFSSPGIEATTVLDGLPDDLGRVEIVVELRENQAEVTETSFEEREEAPRPHGGGVSNESPTPGASPDETPKPSPTVTGGTVTPTPTPTVSVTPTPSATLEPIPNPSGTDTPTPTPTVTPGQADPLVICHNPGRHGKTLSVSSSALQAHLDHGDTIGACE